eukprot:TRINITY_DN15_c0_g1_i1.p1 TRINITY_DN15_c0_g1~~TRINITY_DN15_c0_g1_i1.p1  ORF type:complete len:280 (+),score=77.87 TRINITY_DN15_c0_g1_i1:75-914(+)
MAIGKNKRRPRKSKRKIIDPFKKKDWYVVKAPGMFPNSMVGRSPQNKTVGKNLASDGLKGRVYKVSLADLNNDEFRAYRQIHLIAEAVEGKEVLTNFHGMSFSTDKLKSLIKKWKTLIEAHLDLRTSDGYKIRLFIIGFTRRSPEQRKTTNYATTAQIKQIRKKMVAITMQESADSSLKDLFKKLISETISKKIEQDCQGIYPLQNVYIHKLKVVQKPTFDKHKLAELHAEKAENFGVPLQEEAVAPTLNKGIEDEFEDEYLEGDEMYEEDNYQHAAEF